MTGSRDKKTPALPMPVARRPPVPGAAPPPAPTEVHAGAAVPRPKTDDRARELHPARVWPD